MKKAMAELTLFLSLLVLVPGVSAESKLDVQLKAFNITQNQDATTVKNHPGDVVRYTANVKNLGPDDLVDYEMKVYIKDILKYATIVDLGGGVLEGDYIKFPPILQAFDCNCSNANYFKVALKDSVCEVQSLSATYEYVTVTIPIECVLLPPPPVVPTKSGPATALLLVLGVLFAAGTYVITRQKA